MLPRILHQHHHSCCLIIQKKALGKNGKKVMYHPLHSQINSNFGQFCNSTLVMDEWQHEGESNLQEMFFGMLVSHSPLHMCAHTHKYTYVCTHICDIMSREILLQGKSQERTLAGDHGGTKVPWKTLGIFWLWDKSYWFGIRKSEILRRFFPLRSCLTIAKQSILSLHPVSLFTY